MSSLRPILAPRTIAVIGASRRPGSMGQQVVHNLLSYGFTGAVFPVNPNARAVCGVRAYPTVSELPDRADLGIVVVPREHVMDAVTQCGEAGVKGLIVISAGFREMGADGAARERELLTLTRRYGMRMIGPNCLGVVNANPDVSMNATFATATPSFGHAGFVSQSGALGVSVLDHTREYRIGVSQFVSVGNKADVSGNDLLEAWEHDESVQVVLMYVENFGNPQRFLELARRITKHKPIIVVKSGRSRAGARAASSHTGALAGSDIAVDALLAQAGVLRASTIEELFDMAMAFEVRARPRSRRTAVLTNAGGPGILAADAMEACGLDLVELAPQTVDRLRPLFPPEASIRNPLDMIASATPAGYRTALAAILDDPGVDTVVPIFVPPFGIKQEDVAEAIVGAASGSSKPVLAVLMGRDGLPEGRAELHTLGIPAYVFPESAARAVAALNKHAEWSRRPLAPHEPFEDVDRDCARAILATAAAQGREQLTTVEALELLRAYRVPVARGALAPTLDAAEAIAEEMGYPVVAKLVSPDVIHKSDVGGVQVGITNGTHLRRALVEMTAKVETQLPDARIDGVLVQQQLRGGCETIVGVTRDPVFGPLVMFGLGGIFVEALRDVVFRLAPVDSCEARTMLDEIRGARMLDGMRGMPASDKDALATAIRRIAQLAADFPEIQELDVNPVLAFEDRVVAVDARCAISPAINAPSGAAPASGHSHGASPHR